MLDKPRLKRGPSFGLLDPEEVRRSEGQASGNGEMCGRVRSL